MISERGPRRESGKRRFSQNSRRQSHPSVRRHGEAAFELQLASDAAYALMSAIDHPEIQGANAAARTFTAEANGIEFQKGSIKANQGRSGH